MTVRQDSGAAPQALGQKAKDAVKSWVPKLRKVAEQDFREQLERLGLRRDGRHTPVASMHLTDDARTTREAVEALVRRETLAEGTAPRGFDAVVGELAYTMINRLVGLKAMEARGLLVLPPPAEIHAPPETTEVLTRVEGQPYSRYLRDYRAAHGPRYKYEADAEEALLRDGLTAAFSFVTRDVGVLFDPRHEYSCVWPTHAALTRLINMINEDLAADYYRAPDFLGWVYQFFRQNESDELRKVNQGTPRSSHELAVMNQFYTPGWVVKTLVDNTLGRLWIQMHPDSRLARGIAAESPPGGADTPPAADYLVPNTGEKIRFQRLAPDGRVETFKRAREITLLDPACGTMHFGQYAFALFEQMYLEEIENAGRPGWPTEPSVARAVDIPATIIENNLYGIDIDARAVQIAALSLWLTAREAVVRHGAAPADLRVRSSNLVVANAVGLSAESIRTLVESLGDGNGAERLRERLFAVIWENLQNVGELGSLVQVREGVADAFDDWVDVRARTQGLTTVAPTGEGQARFAFVGEMDQEHAGQLELQRRLLEDEAERLQAELLADLERAALDLAHDPSERLFAEDTARGVRLLQVLSRRYDVVVMNPPYGAFVPTVKDFIKAVYPLTSNDIYAAFIDRATMLVEPEGYVGALVSRTFVTNKTHEALRTEILLKRNPLVILLDLGEGILEATVQTAAIVLRGSAR